MPKARYDRSYWHILAEELRPGSAKARQLGRRILRQITGKDLSVQNPEIKVDKTEAGLLRKAAARLRGSEL